MYQLKHKRIIALSISLAATMGFSASQANAQSLVGINSQNQVGVFDTSNPSGIAYVNLSGLSSGESFLGIDLRPSNNTIYGFTTANKLYTLDAYTGATSFVANLATTLFNVSSPKAYGVDFNPVADRGTGASFRVVSSAGDNYAVNANTGAVTTATSVAAGYSGVAYANSDPTQPTAAPASTKLYYLNSNNDSLSVANSSFNNPSISMIGLIGLDILGANGFELFNDGSAFAAVNVDRGGLKSLLLGIDLVTGKATELGEFTGTINGLTAAPSAVPVPAALPLMASAIGFAGLARRKSKFKV